MPRTTEDRKLFEKIWIHASRHIIINTDVEEETGKSRMGRGHRAINICCNRNEFEPKTGKGVFIRGPINFEFLTSGALYC